MPGPPLSVRPLSDEQLVQELGNFREHWKTQQEADSRLRWVVCLTLLAFTAAQLYFVREVTIGILEKTEAGKTIPDNEFFKFMVIGVFTEITALLTIVVTSLFGAPAKALARQNEIIATLTGAERHPE